MTTPPRVRSRYRRADKAVWRVGYGAMQLAEAIAAL
jgi:hypothetical protein